MAVQIGVDLGGTFTDVVGIDDASGRIEVAKVPTRPRDPAEGFMDGVGAVGFGLDEVVALVHGTTLATNAVLERTGVSTGLITTRGFRDVLSMARRRRPRLWGLRGQWEPLVPRRLAREVDERRDADGRVLVPLEESQVAAAAAELRDAGCRAVVVSFLHAYRDPAHELRAAAIVRRVWPEAFVVTGSQVLPQVREFDRTVTAAVAAYVGPLIGAYVDRLQRRLESGGLREEFFLMQGNGGVLPAAEATDSVVTSVLSGPAAGVVAAAEIGARCGHPNVVSCDLGGTSLDVALIRDGRPSLTTSFEIDFNVPVRVPLVDIRTIGAGGGSIARVDALGVLRVGPDSAGADPGPICYGRGGRQVTLTDANALLGRMVADRLPGVPGVPGGVGAADLERALREQVGDALGLTGVEAAEAVVQVANASMASAIRRVSIEKGHDPRDFALVVFGGAGPLHGVDLARMLGVPTVIVPYYPGLTSALGCLLSDLRRDVMVNVQRPLSSLADDELADLLRRQDAAIREVLATRDLPVEDGQVLHTADLQYAGQTHLFRVAVDPDLGVTALKEEFDRQYRKRYAVDLSERDAVMDAVRTTALGIRRRPDLAAFVRSGDQRGDVASTLKEVRAVRFGDREVDCPVYERYGLPIGAEVAGPAVLDQLDTTVLLPPETRAVVTEAGSLLITLEPR